MKRTAQIKRKTKETDITLSLNIDDKYEAGNISTGLGMLDHMLDLASFHGNFNLKLGAKGDIEVDYHHLIEDIAICLGLALKQALGNKEGIARYGCFFLPMDESLSRTVVDISGRPFHVFEANFNSEAVGKFPTQMIEHFFYSFAINAGITLHQKVIYGDNDHHQLEALFKGLGKALNQAWQSSKKGVNSTKGML